MSGYSASFIGILLLTVTLCDGLLSRKDPDSVLLETQSLLQLSGEGRYADWVNGHVDLSMYHTVSQLVSEFKKLSSSCPALSVSTQGSSEPNNKVMLPLIRIKSSDCTEEHRVLMFFGEHAREIISPESALALARHLCGKYKDTATQAARILKVASFAMFPVINMHGRRLVERGGYCVRTNEDGIDLNRNWGDHWTEDQAAKQRQSFGGSLPFSEPETRILKAFAVQQKPTVFLTIHSGTLGMYTPYAYDGKWPTNSKEGLAMKDLILRLNDKWCRCDAGPAGKEVGYLCPGTCLDWMYDQLKARWAYGFEIYDGYDGYMRPVGAVARTKMRIGKGKRFAMVEEESELLRSLDSLSNSNSSSLWPQPATARRRHCLRQFNPTSKDQFDKTLHHWSGVFLDVVESSIAGAAKLAKEKRT